jgi:hypothetical protein
MHTNPLGAGGVQVARYHEQVIEQFKGNAYIEALPPIVSREQAKAEMAMYPPYDPSEREGPAEVREHKAAGLSETVRVPLAVHAELDSRISRLIRWGYVARNPTLASFQGAIDARESALRVEGKGNDIHVTGGPVRRGPPPSASGLTLLGTTGIGKTVLTEMVLARYPQVIVHREYKGRPFTQTQVVHLTLQCPSDGSIRTLIENFFAAMDELHAPLQIETGYHRDYVARSAAIHRMIPSMARLASQHGLGMLLLDEVQDLNPRGSRAILSFLVALVNTIGVPVVLVGGVDALPVLSAQFRQARRGASQGDLILGRAEPGRRWREFCEVLWRYQYTAHKTELTDTIVEALYDGSQGITDYVVKLYKLAQIRAIATGTERVTAAIIKSVARDSLVQAGPVLDMLRHGRKDKLRRRGDVDAPDGIETVPFIRGDGDAAEAPRPSATPRARRGKAAPDDPPPGRSASTAGAGEQPALPVRERLPDLVRAHASDPDAIHAALCAAGVIRSVPWERAVGASAVAALR